MRQFFLLFILLLFVGRAHAEFKPPSDKKMDALLKKAQEIKVLKPDSALIYAQEVVSWAKKKNEVHTLVHATLVVADIYYYKNEREKGFENLTVALDLCEKHKMEFEKIEIYYSMGLHYSRNAKRPDGSFDEEKAYKALEYHKKAIDLAKKYKDGFLISKGYNLSGVIYMRLGQSEKALEYYEISEKYSRESNDSIGLGYTLDYAGTLLSEMGQTERAEKMLIEALEIRKLLKDTFSYAINLNNMGEFYARNGNAKLGIQYLEESFNISYIIGFQDLAQHTAGLLSGLYQAENRFDLALDLKNREMALKDSLYNVNRATIQEEMDARYEAELRERQLVEQELEITKRNNLLYISLALFALALISFFGIYRRQRLKQELLNKEMILKEQRAQQEMQDKIQSERLRLSRDLHDSLGAELTLISSKADSEAYVREDESKGGFEQIGEISRNASNILRDTIWAIRKDTLDVEEFVGKLMQFIHRRQGTLNIEFDNQIKEEVQLTPSQSLNLFRICQECIHNTIKHAQAQSMKIQMRTLDGQIEIELADDGVGMGDKYSEGYGLNNMRERIAEIGGIIRFDSRLGEGTHILVKAPREI
jgi:signal transduction histidine kinase